MYDLDTGSRHHVPEPDLVPILDGLTSVIFFLLLSISFIGLTKITVPPSSSTVVTTATEKPPLSPKITVKKEGHTLKIKLDWLGDKPNSASSQEERVEEKKVLKGLIEKVSVVAQKFKEQYPDEKTIQLALSEDLNYQEMISIMDGLRSNFEDIVLNSYKEVE